MFRDTHDSAAALRLPPHSLDSEAGVIAACLLDNDKIPDAEPILPDPAAFYRDSHQRLWAIVLDFWREGRTADLVTVATECERRGFGYADGLTPRDAVCELLNGPPPSLSAVEYATEVKRCADLRAVIEAANAMLRDAYHNREEPEAVVSRSIASMTGIQAERLSGTTETLGDLLPSVIGKLASRQDGHPTGVLTPWAELNFLTDGLQPADFVVIAARPSVGKTSFSLNIADFAAVDWKVPTLFVSLEMGNVQLAERMLVGRARVDGHAARTGRLSHRDWQDIERARGELEAAPFRLVRRPGRTLPEIIGEVRRAHARAPIGLVLIDYIQLIRGDNPRESEVQALTRISGDLKGLAKLLECPVVALSQLNRQLESREEKRPRMADIRGSGSIENDADLILFLHRPDYFDAGDRPGVAEVIVGKNRNAPVGEFKLSFVKSQMRFADYDPNAGFVPDPADGPDF